MMITYLSHLSYIINCLNPHLHCLTYKKEYKSFPTKLVNLVFVFFFL